ncbi:hypothetical protein J4407_02325 [Candidatus Pacearchaeota archaeon]|nr:hypothetical protein [Candidatus Pacearchaeota archaeon]
MNLQTIGFDLIDENDKKDFDKIFEEYSERIQKKLKNISSFTIHLKEYNKEGARKKFCVYIHILAPTRVAFKAEAFDWDFKRTLHKAFNKIEQEIEHKFHLSDEHQTRESFKKTIKEGK